MAGKTLDWGCKRVVAHESVIARSRQWEFTVEVSFTVEVALDGT